MQKRDLYFNINLSILLMMILEPCEAKWVNIYHMADNLIQSLPGRIKRIYFLGSVKDYPITTQKDFRDKIPKWFDMNKDRVTIIGYILDKLQEEKFKGMVIVISSVLPVDIEDWHGTDIFRRTLFVNMSDEPFGDSYNQINGALGVERIIHKLDNPVNNVFLKSNGFVPLCFDKGEAIYEDNGFRLEIPIFGENLEFHLKALYLNQPPMLYVQRVKGEPETIYGKEEHQFFSEPCWQEIPPNLKPVIESGICKKEFVCPQCRKGHNYDVFLCPEDGLVLKEMPLNNCILFTKDKWLSLSQWYAYPLEDNKKIITKYGDMYRFEEGRWRLLKKIEPFEEIDDGIWALFHRI